MRRSLKTQFCAILAGTLAASVIAGEVVSRKETLLLEATAEVVALNLDTREITLKNEAGQSQMFIVGPEVKRLDEVKVGDSVKVQYRLSLALELREPTEAEREKPLTIIAAAGRASDASDPAAAGVRKVKAVTTIEEVDAFAGTIVVKGPLGRVVKARVENPANLEKMKVGDTIVITYTDALAVSLEKAAPKSKE